MSAYRNVLCKAFRVVIPAIVVLLFSPGLRAQQFLSVDCTGADPSAFPSINAALSNVAGPGAFIFVTGPCNENVFFFGRNALSLGDFNGQTANINGSISIQNSDNISLHGLNVTNSSGDGIVVGSSRGIILDNCTSSGNAGVGLNVGGMSDVSVDAAGAFDYNARGGMIIGGNSLVQVFAFAGLVDISNNAGPGIFASQANFLTLGSTTVANNLAGPGSSSGFGLDLRGGAHVQFGALFGPNHISGNQSGGASLQETAEISFFSLGQPNLIQGNGPVGVSVGLGSQATFADVTGPLGVQISGHSSAGVDLFANSQAFFLGANVVQGNGSSADARSAGIRVDGNSEAFLRGGQVSENSGPGVLVLVNSSADFAGVSFSGNTEVITCDSSSTMVSDLPRANSTPAAGVSCRTPHALGGRQITKTQPAVPDWSAHKAQHDRYAKLAVKH
jgi:hypothetical protein